MHDFVHKLSHSFMSFTAVTAFAVSIAVFGVGMLNLSQQVEVAILQSDMTQLQTASVVMASPSAALPVQFEVHAVASSPMPMASSTTLHAINVYMVATSCPPLPKSLALGTRDATSTGDVHMLQTFLVNHFGLKPDDVVTGYYGSTTAAYVSKFQAEQGLDRVGIAGALTRAAIVRVCNATMPLPQQIDAKPLATSTESNTVPRRPLPPMLPKPSDRPYDNVQSFLNVEVKVATILSNSVLSLGSGVANVWTGYSELLGSLNPQ